MTMPAPDTIITHTGPVFRVESTVVVDRTGRAMRRDVVRHPGAVTVIPVLADGRVAVIRNMRIAVNERLIEFCAGKLEPGEDPQAAAARELEEECGFRAGTITRLGMFYTSPGFTDERMHVFLATQLSEVPQRLEPGEEIDVELVSVAALRSWIRDGSLRDGKSIAAFALWLALCQGKEEGRGMEVPQAW
ncbi:MAG: NUDIX hydrolase [Phycisphaerae bacterium]|nr:NUDIX hydrolase [Phycisphaerae bacterium]